MSSIANNASLDNPTWEYLHRNFKRTELQKHCRDIGIKKVWVTKEKLIDMILEKHSYGHSSSRPNVSENVTQDYGESLHEAIMEIQDLKEKINMRDMEIEDLNALLKSSQVTINKLNDRLSLVEEQVKELKKATTAVQTKTTLQDSSNNPPLPEGTLLLGDTNFTTIRTSDLHNQCSVRTIKDANIDLMKCWVSERLHWAPKCCILYCGLQDILDRSMSADIFDKLGSLIASLKEVNEEMCIYICELTPVLKVEEYDESINIFNNQLADWSKNNGVSVIETNLQFRLGTSEVDHMCYQENEGTFLNRFGIIRLLNVINKQCPLLKLHDNWKNIMNQDIPAPPPAKFLAPKSNRMNNFNNRYQEGNYRKRPTHLLGRRSISVEEDQDYHFESRNDNDYHRRYPRSRETQETRITQPPRRRNGLGIFSSSSYEAWTQNSDATPAYIHRGQRDRPHSHLHSLRNHEYSTHPRPCHNCGELNHSLSDCRFDYRILCNNCNTYGHKTRLCKYEQ